MVKNNIIKDSASSLNIYCQAKGIYCWACDKNEVDLINKDLEEIYKIS